MTASNLVILQYSPDNSSFIQVVPLDIENLPDAMVSIDVQGETWVAEISDKATRSVFPQRGIHERILRFHKDARLCQCGFHYGVIGVYDCTDTSHLSSMARAAIEAKESAEHQVLEGLHQ